jgi:hypothetical protein
MGSPDAVFAPLAAEPAEAVLPEPADGEPLVLLLQAAARSATAVMPIVR